MVAIRRHQAVITGMPTGPGVSTFYTDNIDGFPAMLRAFYFGLAAQFPSTIEIQVQGEGAVIDDATGEQTGLWTELVPAVVAGTATGAYPAGVGSVATWRTTTIVRGRLLRGRTFLVPLTDVVYDVDGTLTTTARDLQLSSAASLVQDANLLFRVWSRPIRDAQGNITTLGSSGRVTDRQVSDKVAYLRTRRD